MTDNELFAALQRDVSKIDRDLLPAVLGAIVELEARIRMRLSEPIVIRETMGIIDDERAAEIVGMSRRWVRDKTQGMKFRRDLSRKAVRFDEAGFRAWLMRRSGK